MEQKYYQAFRLKKNRPILVVFVFLFFIYALQVHLNNIFFDNFEIKKYEPIEWVVGYAFVVTSGVIFLSSLYLGMSGKAIVTTSKELNSKRNYKRISFATVLIIFAIFFLWSYLMAKLNIGMTIWSKFDPLPFKLAGILFYGRLIIQPIIIAYIAHKYSDSRFKLIVYVLILLLGAWVSLSSGSRFSAILFGVPAIFLFKGNLRFILTLLPILAFLTIATLSRNFYLPMLIGDAQLIAIYANEEYQSAAIGNIWLLPFSFAVTRAMGISEVLMTLNYGKTTPSFFDSLQLFLSHFIPFIPPGQTVSIKNIYGLDDDAFGGLGLDVFSNFWFFFGGNAFLYIVGLFLVGWIFGKSYFFITLGLARFGIRNMNGIVFLILLMIIFEGRIHVLISIFIFSWILSSSKILKSLLQS